MIKNHKCIQCGHCCLNLNAYYTTASQADINMWKAKKRYDILEWVSTIKDDKGHPIVHDIWINSKTGEEVDKCPWLKKLPNQKKYICKIHDVKPETCRNYPIDKEHAIITKCSVYRKET